MGIAAGLHRTIFRSDAGFSPVPPDADFWYTRPGYGSDSGMRVSPETALRIGAVFACVRVISQTLGSLPLIIYRRLPGGGKERAIDHPLYHVLRTKPNNRQTALEWVEMCQSHLELRGNAFSVICPGPGGAIEALVPVHPDRVAVYRLEDGRLRYQVRAWYDGSITNYAQEEIFHLRGMSQDGIVGMSTVAIGREVIGNALAGQEYAARFFSNDSTPRGILYHPGKLTNEDRANMKQSWKEGFGGSNRHSTALLEGEIKYQQIGISNKDSQFLEARQFSVIEICRLFGVPPHKVADLTRGTFSNIEHQSLEFVTDCIRARAVRWEQRISIDLLDPLGLGEEGEYFAEFLVDGLLRADLKSRYEAYAIGLTNGFLCPNKVCEMENMNPLPPGQGGDTYLRAVTLAPPDSLEEPDNSGTGQSPDPADRGGDAPPSEEGDVNALRDWPGAKLLTDFALSAAARVVRKEVTALRKALMRANDDRERFTAEAEDFYSSHAKFMVETMRMTLFEAEKYVLENRCALAASHDIHATLAAIEQHCPHKLAAAAVGVIQ